MRFYRRFYHPWFLCIENHHLSNLKVVIGDFLISLLHNRHLLVRHQLWEWRVRGMSQNYLDYVYNLKTTSTYNDNKQTFTTEKHLYCRHTSNFSTLQQMCRPLYKAVIGRGKRMQSNFLRHRKHSHFGEVGLGFIKVVTVRICRWTFGVDVTTCQRRPGTSPELTLQQPCTATDRSWK